MCFVKQIFTLCCVQCIYTGCISRGLEVQRIYTSWLYLMYLKLLYLHCVQCIYTGCIYRGLGVVFTLCPMYLHCIQCIYMVSNVFTLYSMYLHGVQCIYTVSNVFTLYLICIYTGCIYRGLGVASKKLIVCQGSHLGGKKSLNSTSSTTSPSSNQNQNMGRSIWVADDEVGASEFEGRIAINSYQNHATAIKTL